MKKKIFTLLALFAGVLSASAAGTNTISVKKVYITPGGVVAQDVDDTPQAYYFEQALNGLYTREAIICRALGL